MTPDKLLSGRPIEEEVKGRLVILTSSHSWRWRIDPCDWYKHSMYWQVFNFALRHSRINLLCTVWIENETGNDELLAEYRNGKTIFEADLRYMRPSGT